MAEGAGSASEIRTKVFRMGAPLLRSTIPLNMNVGRPAPEERKEKPEAKDDGDASDVESVLSSSELGVDDIGALNVTLDFPM
jgi:hypothetical protein